MKISRLLSMRFKIHRYSHKRTMIYLTILLIGLSFFFGIDSYAQTYIPETSSSIETAEVILEYSFKPGANSPGHNLNSKTALR